jgi:hypothetical protein
MRKHMDGGPSDGRIGIPGSVYDFHNANQEMIQTIMATRDEVNKNIKNLTAKIDDPRFEHPN